MPKSYSSDRKQSACNAGDPVSIPGSGRSSGEGIGNPLQYSWASLVAQLIKKIYLQCGRLGFDPWVGKILWRRKWQPTPVLLPGKSHGQRSMVGSYSPWGRKESDMTEQLQSLAWQVNFNHHQDQYCGLVDSLIWIHSYQMKELTWQKIVTIHTQTV